ncbi:hypothetical protein WK13_34765 [Burkholderia ubonensis]|uniref:ribonuclease HI n=1 Tax=Burkholderia ubonensis TaxID=101571 RepID=UPI0007537319|nr:RNase H family protein [Burkholderia ubonensis]KVR21703.1 hypothetical protein WK13_34765 [Burkholderia ubonensis]
MLVTLLTDASLCHETKAAGWGYYAISERTRAYGGGPLNTNPAQSTEAEMQAIVNGLHCAVKRGVAEAGDSLIIQTDSVESIRAFTRSRQPVGNERAAVEKFHVMLATYKFDVEFRHVKAHSGVKDKRSFVNSACDRTAKRFMRKMRAERQKSATTV